MALPPILLLSMVLLLSDVTRVPPLLLRSAAARDQGQGEFACMRPDPPCSHRASRPLQLGSESTSSWLGAAAVLLLAPLLLLSSRLHAAALGTAVEAAGSPQQTPGSRCSRLGARRMNE